MSLLGALAILLAGCAAGAVNTIVGSGSLITYPVMVMLGVPPVSANVANTVGLVPGSLAGAWGYRDQLGPAKPLLLRLATASLVGALIGAFLLITLPSRAFTLIVPFLILGAALLVAFQPKIAALRSAERTQWGALLASVGGAGIYGGYFSAAQGVILLGILGIFLHADIQVHNATKNLLQALVNVVAAIFFIATTPVRWDCAGLIAVGAILGALAGARIGKAIPAPVLRKIIVVFGCIMAVYMGWRAFA